MQTSLLKSPLIRQEPVRLFAIAVHYDWREVCEAAAKNTLFHPANDHPAIDELRLIRGLDYQRFLDYHKNVTLLLKPWCRARLPRGATCVGKEYLSPRLPGGAPAGCAAQMRAPASRASVVDAVL